MPNCCLYLRARMSARMSARVFTLALLMGVSAPALAQQVPGPADAARVQERIEPRMIAPELSSTLPVTIGESMTAPEGSDDVQFVLRGVRIDGMSAFDDVQVRDLYAEHLDKEIKLSTVWHIAAALSARYQAAGYFLSRVYVPQQSIEGGLVRLRVVEGYVDEVSLDAKTANNAQVAGWIEQLRGERPLKVARIESLLLRLNDLPGQRFRAVLEKPLADDAGEGATRLSILSERVAPEWRTSFDNYGSRFMGPYEYMQQARLHLLENQETRLSYLAGVQKEELEYMSFSHRAPLSYDWQVDVHFSRTNTSPGHTLKQQDIESISEAYGFGFTYQWWRQRQTNLSTRVGFDVRDTKSDIFNNLLPLTRDHVRALRGSANYQIADGWDGYNLVQATFSQGVDGLGANDARDRNPSRAQAQPDFRKMELQYTRMQPLGSDFTLVGAASGQLASGPLYSSEEFGYGGQGFGRAYDASELTGDHGIAASLEIRYNAVPLGLEDLSLSPYAFYDIGRVYNDDAGQEKAASGSTAGLGMRIATSIGISANLGVAFPLTREIDTPIYGGANDPRYLMQFAFDY